MSDFSFSFQSKIDLSWSISSLSAFFSIYMPAFTVSLLMSTASWNHVFLVDLGPMINPQESHDHQSKPRKDSYLLPRYLLFSCDRCKAQFRNLAIYFPTQGDIEDITSPRVHVDTNCIFEYS